MFLSAYFCTKVKIIQLPKLPYNLSEPWILWAISLISILYISNRLVYGGVYKQIVLDYFFNRDTDEVETRQGLNLFQSVLNVGYILNLALSLFLADKLFRWDFIKTDGLSLFIVYALGLALIYSIKWLVHFINGLVLGVPAMLAEYNRNVFLGMRVAGLLLFPLNIMAVFIQKRWAILLVVLCLAAFGFMWFVRLVRVLITGGRMKLSLYYIILYLCALEAVPVLLAARYLGAV